MPKKVAVSPNLDNIRHILQQRGYSIVGVDENESNIDALVYSTRMSNTVNHPQAGGLSDGGNNKFVLMVNADEKSPEEIVDMIDRI